MELREGERKGLYRLIEGVGIDSYIDAFKVNVKRKKEGKKRKRWKELLNKKNEELVKDINRVSTERIGRLRNKENRMNKIREYIRTGVVNRNVNFEQLRGNEREIMSDMLDSVVLDKDIKEAILNNNNFTRKKMMYKLEFKGVNEYGISADVGFILLTNLSLNEIVQLVEREIPDELDYETINKLKRKFGCEGETYITPQMGSFELSGTNVDITMGMKGRAKRKGRK